LNIRENLWSLKMDFRSPMPRLVQRPVALVRERRLPSSLQIAPTVARDPYNWLDVIGLGLFLMGFSLTLCFTQDSISENWLYKYLTKSPDQIDDIGDDAELAKAAWRREILSTTKVRSQL
jgi:hypothetical protein